MAKIREIVKEEYNSYGQFTPPNPWGHDVSVGREMEGGDDEDMQMDLQADISTNPIPAFPIDERASDISNVAPSVIQKSFEKLGISSKPQLLDNGTMGYAYSDGSKIYKLTTDASEAGEAQKLVGKNNEHIADVYGVYLVKMEELRVPTYLIILEKLNTQPDTFGELENQVDKIFTSTINHGLYTVLQFYKDYHEDYVKLYNTKIKPVLDKFPQANKYWHQLTEILDELNSNGIKSIDIHYNNLGYKKNGNLAFFDLGMSNSRPSNIDVMQLENSIMERVMTYMPKSSAVSVKKKCQLGGNGDGTSTACNQGDINALDFKSINENEVTDNFKLIDKTEPVYGKDEYGDNTKEIVGEKPYKEFRYSDSLGGEAFGRIYGDLGSITQMNSVPQQHKYTPEEVNYKKRGFFKNLLQQFKNNGVHKVRISLQSDDTQNAVKRLISTGVLKNPREIRGSSTVEHPTMFDLNEWMSEIIRNEISKVDGFHRSDASDELAQMTHPALTEFDAYHGTSNKSSFDRFSIDKIGSGDGRDLGGWGIYFTDSPQVASIYGSKIMTVDLKNGNYLNLDETMDDTLSSFIVTRGRKFGLSDENIEQFESDFNDEGYRYNITNKQVYEWLSDCLGTPKVASMFLLKAGFVGNMMHDRTNPDATNYIVFDSSFVKILDDGNSEQDDELYEATDPQYSKWKRENVTYRGISDNTDDEGHNGGMAVFGRGLYSVPASNKSMAKGYGKLAALVNAKPKHPKIFNTWNDAEIWIQTQLYLQYSKAKGKDYPDSRDFSEHTTIESEMLKLGYDGIIIKGREMVNYKPEDVRYYYNERQLEMYYDDFVKPNLINELEWTDTTGGDQDLVGMDGSVPMPNDSTYIPEGKDQKVEYGVAMLDFNIKEWKKILSIIKDDDVYDKPTFGRETKPHVTLLYGFHNGVTPNEVKMAIDSVHDIDEPIDIELTGVSFFETKEGYDVVKFDVKSPILHKINKALKELKHTSSHPVYQPHMTISYVKKGMAKKYARKLKKSIKLQSSEIVYSTKKEKKTKLNENEQFDMNALPFKAEIEQSGGKIYSVGGAVRDGFLNKPSKDLDLLITGLPMDKLEEILSKYGKTDNVGKSFGIIKFNTPKLGELDIAIPRTEKANGQGGYQGFDVSSDHELPIEKDLERRDFTINAMAKDLDGNMIDPYNGKQDLDDKMIRMVNPEAFKDDPLRMIRAVQFASRFGFKIEPKTLASIKENAARIREISPERILIEFDKIVKKGDPKIGAQLLAETGLYQNLFGLDPQGINLVGMDKVKTMGEFMSLLLPPNPKSSPAEFYKTNLKGDLETYNEMRALQIALGSPAKPNDIQTKLNIYNMFKIYPKALESAIIPHELKQNIIEMQKSGMPFSLKELAINGNDLLAMGYTGQQIGELFRKLIMDIYSGKIHNNREILLNYLTPSDPKN